MADRPVDAAPPGPFEAPAPGGNGPFENYGASPALGAFDGQPPPQAGQPVAYPPQAGYAAPPGYPQAPGYTAPGAYYGAAPYYYAGPPVMGMPLLPVPPEQINVCLVILSVLIPLAGWILGCALHGTKPKTACACVTGASISAGLNVVVLIILLVTLFSARSRH
jgi:hypothetical protein